MINIMKKALISFAIILTVVGLCGCKTSLSSTENNDSDPVVIRYSEDGTVNGYKAPQQEESRKSTSSRDENGRLVINSQPQESLAGGEVSLKYCLNKNTKKFHKPECSYVARTKPENLTYADDRQKIISQGYLPCKQCNP